jgi:formylglycine-generating enzyme required for sulfatase activity
MWRSVYSEAWPGIESAGLAGDLPTTQVSWNQCAEFIEAMRQRDGWRYRFPTEAEWEYAARDGLEQAPYPWGHEPLDETRCNFKLPRPVPFGCYPPTRRGFFDVLGNVCEFASDLWLDDGYSHTPYEVVDPHGPSLGEVPSGSRVLMPSACGSPLWEIHARIGWRGAIPPDWATGSLGLRLACDLDE